MRTVLFVLCCLLIPVAVHAAPDFRAIGQIDDDCTAWAVRPRLIVTASHCVVRPGYVHTVSYYRGVQAVSMDAVVVWDGAFADQRTDLALLVPDHPWPAALPVARYLPAPYTPCQSVSYALQVRHYVPRFCTVLQLAYVDGEGWMLVVAADMGPGASGSPIVVGGAVVGVVSAGREQIQRFIAVPAGTLARAIRQFDRDGPMPSQ